MAADPTYQPKTYRKQGGDEFVVADGGIIRIESGGSIIAESGAVMTLPDIALEVGDLALADAKIIVGNAAGKAAAVTPSGDVTITNAGVTAIGAKKVTAAMTAIADGKVLIGGSGGAGAEQTLTGDVTVTNAGVTAIGAAKVTSAMLANGAGWAGLLTAGLGASASYVKTTNGAQTLATGTAGAKTVLFVVTVTEAFADAGGNQPTFEFGEVGTANKFAATTLLTGATLGAVKVFSGALTASTNVIVTATQAVGAGTGAISVMVMILPSAA